jgi:hypothetical protein
LYQVKAQPADVNWNKPFKNFIRNQWVKKLAIDLKENNQFRTQAPNRVEVLNWVVNGWDKSTIISNFEKPNFIQNNLIDYQETEDEILSIDLPLDALIEKLTIDNF